MTNELYNAGQQKRTQVMGNALANSEAEDPHDIVKTMQSFAIEWCWGAIWTRDGLADKERSMINIAMMIALNRSIELEGHMRGALRNGVTPEEIREIILQAAVYCGAPAGGEASRVARKVLLDHNQP